MYDNTLKDMEPILNNRQNSFDDEKRKKNRDYPWLLMGRYLYFWIFYILYSYLNSTAVSLVQ
jgi:hypothetical protein